MAYAPVGSTRINTWSNPELSDGAYAWGVEAGVEADSHTPGTDGADNARLLNLTGSYIASLRGSAEAEIGALGDIWDPDSAGLIAPNQSFQLDFLYPAPPSEQIRWTFGTEPRASDLGSTAWANRVGGSGYTVGSGLPNDVAVWVTVWGRNPTVSYVIAQKRFNRDRIWASCDSFATRVAPEAFMNAACDPNATFGSQCWTSGDVAICDVKDAPPPQSGLPVVHVATRYHEACAHDADHSEVLSV